MSETRGMTMIEVLIAVLVLSAGLLALTTAAAGVSRMIDYGRRSTEAAALATGRIELLRAGGCPAAGTGSTTSGSFSVSWDVTETAKRARLVTVTVTDTGQRIGADTVRTVFACP